MYELAACEIMILLLIYLQAWKSNNRPALIFSLFPVVLAGALTHYYVTFTIVLFACVYGIVLLVTKQFKELFLYILVHCISGFLAYRIFPDMLIHALYSYRGKEIRQNISANAGYIDRFNKFYGYLNNEMFSGMFAVFVTAIVFLAVLSFVKKNEDIERIKIVKILSLMCLPSITYFFVISKSVESQSDRYLFPIFPISVLGVFLLITILVKDRYRTAVLVMIACMVVTGWVRFDFPLLYREEAGRREVLSGYQDAIGIVIGYEDEYYRLIPTLEEYMLAKEVVFVDEDGLDALKQFDLNGKRVLIWGVKANSVKKDVKKIRKMKEDCTKQEHLFDTAYTKVWCLE